MAGEQNYVRALNNKVAYSLSHFKSVPSKDRFLHLILNASYSDIHTLVPVFFCLAGIILEILS